MTRIALDVYQIRGTVDKADNCNAVAKMHVIYLFPIEILIVSRWRHRSKFSI